MQDPEEFLGNLQRAGIHCWAEGDGIKLTGSYRDPTPQELSALAARKQSLLAYLTAAGICERAYSLSQNQRAVWLHGELFPDSARYRMGGVCTVEGVGEETIKRAYVRMLERNPILSSTIQRRHGEPVAVQRPWCALHGSDPLTIIDAVGWSCSQVQEFWLSRYRRKVSLISGPLFGCVGLRVEQRAIDHFRTFAVGPRLPRQRPDDAEHLLLLFDAHHIIMDFLSFKVILRQLRELCREDTCASETAAATTPVNFWDYVGWEHRWLAAEREQARIAHFREYLLPVPSRLEFGSAVNTEESEESMEVRIPLSLAAVQSVRRLAESLNATPFVVMLSAFQTLIAHYCGTSELACAIPLHGRPRALWQNVIGYFANITILRQRLDPTLTTAQLVEKNRDRVLESLRDPPAPFPWLMRRLQQDASIAQDALAQIAFVWDPKDREKESSEIALDLLHVEQGAAIYDLTLTVHVSDDHWICAWRYDPKIVPRDFVASIARAMEPSLGKLCSAPYVAQSRLALSQAPPWHRPPRQENFAANMLREAFAKWANQFSNTIALRDGDRVLSFAALDSLTNKFAHALASRCDASNPVAVFLDRGIDSVLIVIALVKLGVPYVPINTQNPRDRISAILERARCRVVVSDDEHLSDLTFASTQLLTTQQLKEEVARGEVSSSLPPGPAHHAQPAYIMFTSGSTGQPKGVSVSYGSLIQLLQATQFCFLSELQNWTLFHALSFDFSVWEMWGPLLNGKTLTVLSDSETASPTLLFRALQRDSITHLSLTPPACQLVYPLIKTAAASGTLALKTINLGGTSLPLSLAKELRELGLEVWNFYGPTEATVWSTCARFLATDQQVEIGMPLAGTRAYVLSDSLQWVPENVAGELYLAGPHLAEYLTAAETAASFIPDPFADGARMYRTGDRATYTTAGGLRHLGRKDRQVKLHGYRIELGDIEHAVLRHPAIRAAVCVQSTDSALTVFYVCGLGDTLEGTELQRHTSKYLPRYVNPLRFVQRESLPLNRNGKIDTAQLMNSVAAHGIHSDDRDEWKTIIRGAWKEVLGVDVVEDDANFYEMGGTSFALIKVHELLSRHLGEKCSLLELYINPTVDQLASRLVALTTGSSANTPAAPAQLQRRHVRDLRRRERDI